MTLYEIHHGGHLFHLTDSPDAHAVMTQRLDAHGHDYTTKEGA